MANSLLRRYTPPTCTLEVAASESALSRWAERPVLKQLQFQLSFDDPRIPEDSRVAVEGDRTHLEALVQTVTNYVQDRLQDGIEPFEMPIANAAGHTTGLSGMPQVEPSASVHTLSNRGIWLEPKGLVTHTLWLGDLATAESGSSVKLSTLQLYDLANALEEYAADSLVLPSLGRSPWRMPSTGWARTAAMLVFAVGVTATMGKFIVDLVAPPMQTASAPSAQETAPTSPFTLDLETSPGSAAAGSAAAGSSAAQATPTAPPANTNLPPIQFSPGNPARPAASQRPRAAAARPNRPGNGAVAQRSEPAGEIPALPSMAPIAPPIAIAPPAPSAANETMAQSDAASRSADLAAPSGGAAPSNSTTAFDTVPQVAEARDYMSQRWAPPEDLTQVLEYQISLNTDGSVRQITPLGQSSWVYLAKTGLPAEGAPFVAPFAAGETPQFRIVLNPDGRVQTFLQALE